MSCLCQNPNIYTWPWTKNINSTFTNSSGTFFLCIDYHLVVRSQNALHWDLFHCCIFSVGSCINWITRVGYLQGAITLNDSRCNNFIPVAAFYRLFPSCRLAEFPWSSLLIMRLLIGVESLLSLYAKEKRENKSSWMMAQR